MRDASRRLRVAVVGCGRIADLHLESLYFHPNAEIVGVCDRDPLMAYQAGRLWGVPHYDALEDLLSRAAPEVVHITTPPASHRDIAVRCIDHGCHLYVEKPLAVNATEAREVVTRAEQKGVKLAVGYNALFSRAFERSRRWIREGRLGGRPHQIETFYAYPLSLKDLPPWVLHLPGGWIQNVISHALIPAAEWLEGTRFEVTGSAFQSPELARTGQTHLPDELRAVIRDEFGRTAIITFSSLWKPPHQLGAVYRGPAGSLYVENNTQTVWFDPAVSYRSYLNYLIPPWKRGWRWIHEAVRNAADLTRNRNRTQYGMQRLMDELYHSILHDGPWPLPADVLLREAMWLDRIVDLIRSSLPEGVS